MELYFLVTLLLALVKFQIFVKSCEDQEYMKFGEDHTMCMHKPKNCAPNKQLLAAGNLNCDSMKQILLLHNEYRNLLASGGVAGQPPAQNMLELRYDPRLGVVAQRWAEQCTFQHDHNRKIAAYWSAGQCMGVRWTYTVAFNLTLHCTPDFEPSIKSFFEEHSKFNPFNISPFRFTTETGHYTQIMHAESGHVGCGFSCYSESQKNVYGRLYVCNYGPSGNVVNGEMYVRGKPNCAAFGYEPSPRYQSLCVDPKDTSPIIPECTDTSVKASMTSEAIKPSAGNYINRGGNMQPGLNRKNNHVNRVVNSQWKNGNDVTGNNGAQNQNFNALWNSIGRGLAKFIPGNVQKDISKFIPHLTSENSQGSPINETEALESSHQQNENPSLSKSSAGLENGLLIPENKLYEMKQETTASVRAEEAVIMPLDLKTQIDILKSIESTTKSTYPIQENYKDTTKYERIIRPQQNLQIIRPQQSQSIVRPLQNQQIIRPQQNQPIIRPQQNRPIVRPQQNQQLIRPSQNQPIVRPLQNQQIIRPQQNQPIIRPQQNQPIVRPLQNQQIIRPQQNQPIIRPQQNQPIVRPQQNQQLIRPSQNQPIVRPLQNQQIISPQQNRPIIRPQQNQSIVRPQQNQQIIRPQQNRPLIRPQKNRPLIRPQQNQPVVRPQQNPGQFVGSQRNQQIFRPQQNQPIRRPSQNQ